MAGNSESGRKGKTRVPDSVPQNEWTTECPEWFDDRARAYWDDIVPLLLSRNIISDLDAFAVVRLCQLYSEWHGCIDIIAEEGQFVKHTSDRGQVNTAAHPATKNKREYEAELTKLSAKFGLTPKDREGIKAHKGKVSRSIREQY